MMASPAPAMAQGAGKSVKERQADLDKKVKKARQIRQRAQTLARRGLYDTALSTYQRALRVYPKYPAVWNEIGVILVKRQQFDRAAAAFNEALKMNPEMSTAWINLAEAQRRLKRCEDAIQSYRKFLELKPEDGPGYYGMAACYATLKKKNEALWALEKYLSVDPGGRFKREVTKRAAMLIKDGVKSVPPEGETAVAKKDDPKKPGDKKPDDKKDEPEVADAEPAGETAPDEPGRLKKHRGDALFFQKRYVDAIKAYLAEVAEQQAKTVDAPVPVVRTKVATKRARPKTAKGKKPAPPKKVAGPVDVELLYKVGAVYAIMGDYRLSLRWWRRALAAAPERDLLIRHIGLAARKMAAKGQLTLGDSAVSPNAAVETARKAMVDGRHEVALTVLDGLTDREAYYLRGEAALRLGKLVQAKQNFQVILKQDPKNQAALGGLAEALVRLKDSRAAQKALDQWLGDRMALPEDFLVMRSFESKSRIEVGPAADKPSDGDDDFDDDL